MDGRILRVQLGWRDVEERREWMGYECGWDLRTSWGGDGYSAAAMGERVIVIVVVRGVG